MRKPIPFDLVATFALLSITTCVSAQTTREEATAYAVFAIE